MATGNTYAIPTWGELDTELSSLQTDIDNNHNSIIQNTQNITALQNQMNELSAFESGSIKNFYFADSPSLILTNKGTLSYKLYKIGKLVYAEFQRLSGNNNSISSGVTLYSEKIETQSDFGNISISQTQDNVTYKIMSTYNYSTGKYKYSMSITTTASSATMSNVYLTEVNLFT